MRRALLLSLAAISAAAWGAPPPGPVAISLAEHQSAVDRWLVIRDPGIRDDPHYSLPSVLGSISRLPGRQLLNEWIRSQQDDPRASLAADTQFALAAIINRLDLATLEPDAGGGSRRTGAEVRFEYQAARSNPPAQWSVIVEIVLDDLPPDAFRGYVQAWTSLPANSAYPAALAELLDHHVFSRIKSARIRLLAKKASAPWVLRQYNGLKEGRPTRAYLDRALPLAPDPPRAPANLLAWLRERRNRDAVLAERYTFSPDPAPALPCPLNAWKALPACENEVVPIHRADPEPLNLREAVPPNLRPEMERIQEILLENACSRCHFKPDLVEFQHIRINGRDVLLSSFLTGRENGAMYRRAATIASGPNDLLRRHQFARDVLQSGARSRGRRDPHARPQVH